MKLHYLLGIAFLLCGAVGALGGNGSQGLASNGQAQQVGLFQHIADVLN